MSRSTEGETSLGKLNAVSLFYEALPRAPQGNFLKKVSLTFQNFIDSVWQTAALARVPYNQNTTYSRYASITWLGGISLA